MRKKYVPFDKYNKTEIKIGYLGETLIYWKFENPMAPGYNRQQELEYFYRHWFDTSRSYGDPGLELNEINIQAIDKLFCEGLKGKEVQYYNNKQLIKSKLYIHYGNDQDAVSSTIHFSKKGIWQKFLNFFARSDEQVNIQINEIDLANVFNGLKIS
ncbi:hypothetical protein ACN9ML_17475 [Dyadobacter endophyticus]|uniref:hypothetical protein n=1 Tax=Dyadobacter endophyticus TaxID=1749036 RepID=UPI003CEA4D7C